MGGSQRDQRAAQDKPSRPSARTASLIDWVPEDNQSESSLTNVDSVYQQLEALDAKDQEELMNRYGGKEGNFSEA